MPHKHSVPEQGRERDRCMLPFVLGLCAPAQVDTLFQYLLRPLGREAFPI